MKAHVSQSDDFSQRFVYPRENPVRKSFHYAESSTEMLQCLNSLGRIRLTLSELVIKCRDLQAVARCGKCVFYDNIYYL